MATNNEQIGNATDYMGRPIHYGDFLATADGRLVRAMAASPAPAGDKWIGGPEWCLADGRAYGHVSAGRASSCRVVMGVGRLPAERARARARLRAERARLSAAASSLGVLVVAHVGDTPRRGPRG